MPRREERPPPRPREPPALRPGWPTPLAKFCACFDCGDPNAKEQRNALFSDFDANGNGYISLAEACAGVLKALSNKWGKEGRVLFDRYYRSYIRAFNDAKDAALARTGHANDDDYVTKSEFRLLVVYLDYYARWYELFMAIDGRTDGVTAEDDHRISKDEWAAALKSGLVQRAAATYADFVALRDPKMEDFDEMDQNRGGYIDLQEFCEWIESKEKLSHTAAGADLGVNEPIDKPHNQGAGRKWFTMPLEMSARSQSRR